MSERYCRDCKYFSGVHFANCHHPESPKDLVYGWSTKAVFMRSDETRCGSGARLFEGKETPPNKVGFFRRIFGT